MCLVLSSTFWRMILDGIQLAHAAEKYMQILICSFATRAKTYYQGCFKVFFKLFFCICICLLLLIIKHLTFSHSYILCFWRYKIKVRVIDETNSATFVIFDRDGTMLFNKTCVELFDISQKVICLFVNFSDLVFVNQCDILLLKM